MKRFACTFTFVVTLLLCATMWAQSYNFEIVKYPANNGLSILRPQVCTAQGL